MLNSIFMASNTADKNDEDKIYLSIDHLKRGKYIINILLKGKVIKSVKIKKK